LETAVKAAVDLIFAVYEEINRREKMNVNNYEWKFIAVQFICIAIGILLTSFVVSGDTKEDPLHTELKLVKEYAPILWLETDERLYPMLINPFAFDGIDNNDNGKKDLNDPDEVCMGYGKPEELSNLVDGLQDKGKLPPPRVIYYHQPKEKCKGTDVYQYWFYYLFDQGVGFHEHDSEHAFVFVDKPGEKFEDKPKEVRGVVGAGHTEATANNILIVGRKSEMGRQLPRNLPKHMPILVELGKHASAPDRSFDGRFDVGMDANLFYTDVWGSRDVMTAFGINKIRRVTSEYSFPRDETTLIFEKEWHETWEFTHEGLLFSLDQNDIDVNDINFGDPNIWQKLKPGFAKKFKKKDMFDDKSLKPDSQDSKLSKETLRLLDQNNIKKYLVEKEEGKLKVYDADKEAFGADRDYYQYLSTGEYYESLSSVDKANMKKYKAPINSKFGKGKEVYQLFPLEDMRKLYALLRKYNDPQYNFDDFPELKDDFPNLNEKNVNKKDIKEAIVGFLNKHKECFWGDNASDEAIQIPDNVLDKMAEWPEKPKKKEHHQIWRHEDYKNPDNVFKLWLFPRLTTVVAFNLESGDTIWRFGGQISDLGTISLPALGDVPILPNSTLELCVDIDPNDDKHPHNAGITFNFFRGRHQGWYSGLAWGDIRSTNHHLAVSGGYVPLHGELNSLPVIGRLAKIPVLGSVVNHVQLKCRVGIRAEFHSRIPKEDRNFKPIWRTKPIRFKSEFGLSITRKIWGPKHPLTY